MELDFCSSFSKLEVHYRGEILQDHDDSKLESQRFWGQKKEKGNQEVIKKVKLNVLIMQDTKMAAIVRMVTGVILGVDLMNQFSF